MTSYVLFGRLTLYYFVLVILERTGVSLMNDNELIEKFLIENMRIPDSDPHIKRIISSSINNALLKYDFFPIDKELSVFPHHVSANYFSSMPLHSHDFFELVYVYRGKCSQTFFDHTLTLEEGSFLLLNTHTHHGTTVTGDKDIIINILLHPDLLNRSFFSIIADNTLFYNFFMESLFRSTAKDQYLLFTPCADSRAIELTNHLLLEFIEKPVGYHAAMQSYLSLLFTELIRKHPCQFENKNAANIQFTAVLTYINEHLGTVTLNELAEYFHYDQSYLSKLFKKYAGQSFSALVGALKLEKAANLLKNTHCSIDMIVEQLGYYDRSYFNRQFKKKYGVSPHTYRETEKIQ